MRIFPPVPGWRVIFSSLQAKEIRFQPVHDRITDSQPPFSLLRRDPFRKPSSRSRWTIESGLPPPFQNLAEYRDGNRKTGDIISSMNAFCHRSGGRKAAVPFSEPWIRQLRWKSYPFFQHSSAYATVFMVAVLRFVPLDSTRAFHFGRESKSRFWTHRSGPRGGNFALPRLRRRTGHDKPRHYRDSRNNVMLRTFAVLPREEIFTGRE